MTVEFVAVGYVGETTGSGFSFDNIVLHSEDGVTWGEQHLPEFHTGAFWDEPTLRNVIYLGSPVNKWIITGGNRKYWYSADGINWTESRVTFTLPHTGDSIHDMAVRPSDGMVMCIGTQGLVCTTMDITAGPGSWTQRAWDAAGNNHRQRIAYGHGFWIRTHRGYSTGPRVMFSNGAHDGTTWDTHEAVDAFLGINAVGQIYDVGIGPGIGSNEFYFIGRNGAQSGNQPIGNPLVVGMDWNGPTGWSKGNYTPAPYNTMTGHWFGAKPSTLYNFLMDLQTPGSFSNDFSHARPHELYSGSIPLGLTSAAVDMVVAAEPLEKMIANDVAYSPSLTMAIAMGYNGSTVGVEYKQSAVWRSVGSNLGTGRWTKGLTGIDMQKSGGGAGQVIACAGRIHHA